MIRGLVLACVAGCGGWRVDALVVTGERGDEVLSMLAPWEGATQRPPRLRTVEVTDTLPVGCREACYDAASRSILVDAALPAGRMNHALAVAMGRSLDEGADGKPISGTGHWTWYGSLFQDYAADRFSRAVGLGPLGVEVFPEPSEDCDVTDTAHDVLAVRRSVFQGGHAALGPKASPVRTIDLPLTWRHLPPEVLPGGGVRLRGRMGAGEAEHIATIDLPFLDGPSLWVTYPGERSWEVPSVVYLDPPGETGWAPGLGAELIGNYAVGDSEIAGAWLESSDPLRADEAAFVVIERARDGGEVLAVHRTDCPRREFELSFDDGSYGHRPLFVPFDAGVWVIAFPPGGVRMQRFGDDDVALAPRRVEVDPELLFGGTRFELRW